MPAALLTLVLACLLAPAAAAQAPPNDAFAQAAPLSGVPSVVRGSLAEATPESGEPSHSPSARTARSVWFRLTPSETVPVLANTCDADFDSVVAVYTGPSLDRLSMVAAGDDECAETGSEVAFLAEAGTTYHLVVASFARPAGPGFTLQLERAPLSPNDAFADARLMRGPGRVRGTNLLATREFGEPDHVDAGNLHSVWFRYEPLRDQRVTIDTIGSTFDTVLAVYQGELGDLRQLEANDDGDVGLTTEVALSARRGQTYWIALDGLDGAAGAWELGISDGGAAGEGLELGVAAGQDLDVLLGRGLLRPSRAFASAGWRSSSASERTARRMGLGGRPTAIARLRGTVGGDVAALPAVLRISPVTRAALAGETELTVSVVARLLGTAAPGRARTQQLTLRR